MRAAQWLERSSTVLGAIALFALGFRYMDLLGDSFWSIATGRWILAHGRLPSVDPFSFTANRPWIVHMPLSQIVFAWVAQAWGLLALELFGALLFAFALLLLWLPHTHTGVARCVVFPLLVLLVFVQADDLCVRGQLFGDLGFAVLLLCLFRLRSGRGVHPAWAFLLGSAWINLHSSAFLCVVLPLAWAALLRLEPASHRPALRGYCLFAGAAALGLLANPYGVHLVSDLMRLLLASSTQQIDLFRPPDFGAPSTLAVFAVAIASAVWCALRRDDAAGAGLAEALLLVAWAAAAASARRYLPLSLAFSIAVLGRRAAHAVHEASESSDVLVGREPLSSPNAAPTVAQPEASGALIFPRHGALDLASAAALALVATALSFWGLATDKDPWRDVPLDEARAIERLGLPDHVLNIYQWGGFLDYAWDGRRKVFVDGRNQLFEHGAFEDEARIERLENWAAIMDRYRINTVLWEKGSALDVALAESGAWQEVHRGRIAVLYVRRPSQNPPARQRHARD